MVPIIQTIKTRLPIVILILSLILLLILILVIQIFRRSPPIPSPSPTKIPTLQSPLPSGTFLTEPLPGTNFAGHTDLDQVEKDSKVGQLLNRLPYKGSNFRLDYSYTDNQFILILNQASRDEGEKEFDQFLQQNNIASRDWLKNLQIMTTQVGQGDAHGTK